jgi:hypothetical protein
MNNIVSLPILLTAGVTGKCGRAGILLVSRKNSKPENCLKMPQNPTRQVHALLGGILIL